MSLQEKLAKKSEELARTKAEQEFTAQEQELKPIRDHIKELESEKSQLDLIKGSLELKSGDKTGKGMREYSKDTEEKTKKESAQLDTLIDKNKEVLQTMGVESKDQLISNEEFADDPEVVSYKKAQEETEGVKTADASLQEKLKSLGIDIDPENFSYDTAEKALSEKLQSLESELLQEKLKTPEGKEEAIETIAKNFESTLPQTSFSQDEKTKEYNLSIGSSSYDRKNISIKDDKVNFKEWYNAKLLPENIKELESKYGSEIVEAAVKRSYDKKLDQSFKGFDSINEQSYSLKEQLEPITPEEGEKARKAMQEFSDLQNEFRTTISEKAKELKENGIDFDPVFASGYGGKYEDYIQFTYAQTVDEIKNDLQNTGAFPPKFDFKKLQDAISTQKEKLQEFVKVIKNLNTQEDVDSLLEKKGGNKEVISKVRLDLQQPNTYDLYFKLNPSENARGRNNDLKPIEQLKSQAKTYYDAKDYLDKKIAGLEALKGKIAGKMELAINAQSKRDGLQKELETQKFARGSIGNIEGEISRIERNKKDAMTLMTELVKLESEIPQEPVVLNGGEIRVTSVGQQLEQLKKDRETEEQNLRNLKQKISNHESNKPKLFGKDKWEKDLSDLKQEQKDLEEKIRKMGNEDYSNLYKKYSYRIPVSQYSDIEKLVNEQKYVQGTPSEVFADLKDKLNGIANAKTPESVVKLYSEYKELEKQLA